jgi:hypothetical protein
MYSVATDISFNLYCYTWYKCRKCIQILVGKSEGKRPFGRPRNKWSGSIRTNLNETEWEGVGWINLAQDRDQ